MNTSLLTPHAGRHALAAALTLLVVGLTIAPAAQGFSPPNPSNPPEQWAYAGWNSVTDSGTFSNGMGSYQYAFHGFYAWAVVYTQTNLSTTQFMVEGQRALYAVYFAQFCSPTCGQGNNQQNMTVTAVEHNVAFANLTTTATVDLNGSAVPAVGILDTQSTSSSNITQSMNFQGTTTTGQTVSGWGYLSAAAQSMIQVAFQPSLGLFPLNSTPGQTWSATANFTAQGSFGAAMHGCFQVNNRPATCQSASPSGSVQASGNVTLVGMHQPPIRLANGMVADQDVFGLMGGPFGLWDGFFLVPLGGMIMSGGGAPPPSSPPPPTGGGGTGGGSPGSPPTTYPSSPQGAIVATGAVDMGSGLAHLGFIAAMTSYAPMGPVGLPMMGVAAPMPGIGTGPAGSLGATSSGQAQRGLSATTGSPAATSTPGAAGVQAQPIDPSQVAGLEAGWASALAGATSLPGPHGGGLPWLGIIVIAGLAGAAIVGALAMTRGAASRRLPDPAGFAAYRRRAENHNATTLPSSEGRGGPARPGRQVSGETASDPTDALI